MHTPKKQGNPKKKLTKGQKKVKQVLGEFKKGKLKAGRNGKKVTKRGQAIAIALSEARGRGLNSKIKPAPKKRKTMNKK